MDGDFWFQHPFFLLGKQRKWIALRIPGQLLYVALSFVGEYVVLSAFLD